MDSAVILAAGRGSRMRRVHESVDLSAPQAETARTGLKALIPVGRPLIDFLLSGLADAGYRRVCLVIGPNHDSLRTHCQCLKTDRIVVSFAVQSSPLGTADAVSTASEFVKDQPFLVINSDNYYPIAALSRLRTATGPAVAAFRPEGLCRGNISAERLRGYSILSINEEGKLLGVIEKPSERIFANHANLRISMNCWRFSPKIIQACSTIERSARGEYELTDAVSFAIKSLGERFEVFDLDEPVLDLSTPADIAEVARCLASVEVRL